MTETCANCGAQLEATGQCGFCERFDAVEKKARSPAYEITTEELLADLRSVADHLGETPTMAQYNESGTYSASTVVGRFGRWNEGVAAAGLMPNPVVCGREEYYSNLVPNTPKWELEAVGDS